MLCLCFYLRLLQPTRAARTDTRFPDTSPVRSVGHVRARRVTVGTAQGSRPYDAALLNISAMSFGSLGARAIEALNLGAKRGRFYHDTGEGGLSPYHRTHGGDIVWELGSGYFGCRDESGRFDPERFRDVAQIGRAHV